MAPSPTAQAAASTPRGPARPPGRYGEAPTSRRGLGVVAAVLAGLLVLAGLGWVSWGMLQPSAEGEVATFEVIDDASVELVLEVTRPVGTTAVCTIEALGSGYGQVGIVDVTVPPSDTLVTRVSLTIATSERANVADLRSCRLV